MSTNHKQRKLRIFPAAAFVLLLLLLAGRSARSAERPLVELVDPFLGTAPLTNVEDIGFEPPWRVWAGLTFPGASMPNGMVQLSPITEFGSGAGYEYEDQTIHAFTHTNKGHWNLCHLPLLPATGEVNPDDYASPFQHETESASPGYYQVLLSRYGVNAELTTTLRCGLHRYTFKKGAEKKLVVNLGVSNERVHEWRLERQGDNAISGYQHANERVYFYAQTNHKIAGIDENLGERKSVSVVKFEASDKPLEVRIGLSFVSAENAKQNLEKELAGKTFEDVRRTASETWEELLSKVQVTGGTERERGLFYSCLYRSFLWPALRSDASGEFYDQSGAVVNKGFGYYTIPSLWDDYRNKLVLLGMLSPRVTEDVIQSMVDRGGHTGFMPTFFHGDHATPFITGMYLRGVRGYDVEAAYRLLLNNATVERRRARPYLTEYVKQGYVSTRRTFNPRVETQAKAGVTKTLEYAYDDYALALLAEELGDHQTHREMLRRSQNYKNLFDASTGLMRGRHNDGQWVTPFDAKHPYYEYMYREANAWQSSFFAPHDTEGLIALYPDKEAFEKQLDQLFSIPWDPSHIAMNVNSFIGQYCHGNQPDHGFPYLYYWVGKQHKSQALLNTIMQRFYGMDDGRTLCGMDDAGEMSAWYVMNAVGLYPYSPADPEYLVTVPMFERSRLELGGHTITIVREGEGPRIEQVLCDGKPVEGYFVTHEQLLQTSRLTVKVGMPPAGDQ